MKLTNKIAHYGDIIAIPFFIITFLYFYSIENKTILENLIMIFITIALLCDILFTYIYLASK